MRIDLDAEFIELEYCQRLPMISVTGFRDPELVKEGTRTSIVRARRAYDGQSVVLKILKNGHAEPEAAESFRREFRLLRSLEIEGVAGVLGMETHEDSMVIVLEDFGTKRISDMFVQDAFSLGKKLSAAVSAARILARLHSKSIVHGNIRPSHILVDPDSCETRLVGFSKAVACDAMPAENRKSRSFSADNAYAAPEQTGRIDRVPDRRSDLYSLGIVLYELFAGEHPFQTADPVEMLHAHIARSPVPLCDKSSRIPRVLSDIVGKLTAKVPEDRYQTAGGLCRDLERCLANLGADGAVEYFEPGGADAVGRFRVPDKLYSRENEVFAILEAFDRVRKGSVEMVLVSGYPGAGKTALVEKACKPLMERHGYFISGKFEQLQQNAPYFSFVQAFRWMARFILTESRHSLAQWKRTLSDALSSNARVVADLIPELELILGPLPAVPELSPKESDSRFRSAFQKFVGAWADEQHPLVIFLDDLQWADNPSLKLVRGILSNPEASHLMVIGAYRHTETGPDHSLTRWLEELGEKFKATETLWLKALEPEIVGLMVADAFQCDYGSAMDLAGPAFEKTCGNPFFLSQFLKALHDEGLAFFDAREGKWRWDIEAVRLGNLSDNIVAMMLERVRRLPERTRTVLTCAACIGNVFDVKMLSKVADKSVGATLEALWPSREDNLVLPCDCRSFFFDEALEESEMSCKFLHDHVQQAACSLLDREQKRRIHLKIGRLILDGASPEKQGDILFDAVSHLNLAGELVEDPEERARIARLDLEAGNKARNSAAFEPALEYFEHGLSFLEKKCREEDRRLWVDLYLGAAEAAYLCGDFARAEGLSGKILEMAISALDKSKVFEIGLQINLARNDLKSALRLGLDALKLLGIRVPLNPGKARVVLSLLKTRALLAGKSTRELEKLPELADETVLAQLRILSAICSPSYWIDQDLMVVLCLKMLRITVARGLSPFSPFAFAGYGFILCATGRIAEGAQFGDLALKLLQREGVEEQEAKIGLMVETLIRHWTGPARQTLSTLEKARLRALEIGDIEFAAYCAQVHAYHSLLCGTDLDSLEKKISDSVESIRAVRMEPQLNITLLHLQAVRNLRTAKSRPWIIAGKSYDEHRMRPWHQRAGDLTTLCTLDFYGLVFGYLFGNHDYAMEKGRAARKNLHAVGGTLLVPFFHMFDALNRLAYRENKPLVPNALSLSKVMVSLKKLRQWGRHAPMNHRHKYFLVLAELAAKTGFYARAIRCFNLAASGVESQNSIFERALIYERFADFWIEAGETGAAALYMKKARSAYRIWGADAKVGHLDEKYPFLLFDLRRSEGATRKGIAPAARPEDMAASMDLEAVIRASRALSGEIVTENLLKTLVKILMETAGATKVCLLLEENGGLFIEAESDCLAGETRCLAAIPFERSADIVPCSIVNYCDRTGESLVIENVREENLFSRDPYIVESHVKSALCIPLVRQKKTVGFLYLENSLAPGVFTPGKIELLKVLSAQAAISIENARFFEGLEKKAVESEERFRVVFEQSVVGIACVGPDGQILEANQALADILDRPVAELLRMNVVGIPSPEPWTEDITWAAEILSEHSSCTVERPFFRKNGDLIWGKITASLVRKSDGSPVFAVAIVEDITARKKAEQALKQSEEKYRSVAERAGDGIAFVIDEKIHYANPRLAEMTGRLPDEITELSFSELIHPDERKRVMGMLEKRLAGERVVSVYETVLQKKSGEKVYVEFNAGLAAYQGKNADLVFIRDVSERKKIEDELLKMKKHESIGILAGGIAHDYNNILAAILGNLSMARLAFPQETVPEILEKAEKAAFKAKELTSRLLNFSRGGKPNKQTANIVALMQNVCDITLMGSKSQFAISAPKDLPDALVDESQMERVISNIVMNAREAMPDGGLIYVEVEDVRLQPDNPVMLQPGRYLKISIRDQGRGIPDENLQKVFDPYFSTKVRSEQKGMGMGLAVSLSVVRRHGGAIAAESVPDIGSSFHIYLPAYETPEENNEDLERQFPLPGKKQRILVMDDEELVSQIARDILVFEGFDVEICDSGQEAVKMYEKAMEDGARFDAVLLDLTVRGGLGGDETLERMRSIDPDVKAIISSGYSGAPAMTGYSAYGFCAAVSKPYTSGTLARAVRKVLSQA